MLKLDQKALAELHSRLKEVEAKIAKKALRNAARKAMSIVRAEVKANAPRDTGLLKAHFSLLTTIRGGAVYAKVGVRGGGKMNPETPYYFRMIEFGTQHQPANPFMLPALEKNAQAVADTVADELKKALDRL
jgi:HK97 gp10 family phage protein